MKNIKEKMKSTYQIEGKQTILQHGLSVFKYSSDLINHLEKNTPLKNDMIIPDFIYENKTKILSSLVGRKDLKHYCIFHDLGKPFCLPDN